MQAKQTHKYTVLYGGEKQQRPCLATKVRVAVREYNECAYLRVCAITGTSTEPNYSVLPLQATNNLTAWRPDILIDSLIWIAEFFM